VSHNFEMLKVGSSEPDPVVVRRFETLCRMLREQNDVLQVVGFRELDEAHEVPVVPAPTTRFVSTARRMAEQAMRRLG
jgi:hypothetical protein